MKYFAITQAGKGRRWFSEPHRYLICFTVTLNNQVYWEHFGLRIFIGLFGFAIKIRIGKENQPLQ